LSRRHARAGTGCRGSPARVGSHRCLPALLARSACLPATLRHVHRHRRLCDVA
jgi:hypothetical protein